jgi:hypothetical protein
MTTDSELDRTIQDYLQSGPAELSDRVLWAARAQLNTTRRRRAGFAWLTPWRDLRMSQSTRILLAGGSTLALVVAIGAGILGTAGGGHDAGRTPSAPPSGTAGVSARPSGPAPSPSPVNIPVTPAQSVTPLSSGWDTAGGPQTKLGIPEMAPDGRIWVASSADKAFRILTPDGQLAEKWGPPAGDPHAFKFTIASPDDNAGAIAFAPDGGFWVLDAGHFRVERFDSARKFLGAWGRFGSGTGEFAHPNDIAVDRVGAVFVADDGRKDIQVFSSDGVYERSVAVGFAGSFVSANGDGFVDTSLLPDGRPGLTEYKPDGSVQGGLDMSKLMPTPLGMTRDAQTNLYVVGLDGSDVRGIMVRFGSTGAALSVWDAGGIAVAVSPAGDAAYVLQPTGETIRKYVIPAP